MVHEAVVEGLRVNVEKLAGGTTNLERLARQLQARSAGQGQAQQPVPQEPGQKASRPPALEVGRAALEDARFAFLDRTVPGAKELFVDHVDAEVRDLSVGKPLELLVKAAVLANRQNLELRVKAAPLPPSLVPVPEQVTLKVQPIDLTPLAPFLPRSVGLQGGRFQADLQAALGAAVPGGSGETKVLGGFKATQLAFAGQAGGKRLDASLDADLTADPRAGDLDLKKLDLVVGPATLSGHGRASGLLGASPKVEGLEITSRGLDPAALTEYYPPLRKQMGGAVVAGPVGLSVRGQGSATAQRIDVRVDLTPVRLDVPHQLEKAAGAPLVLTAGADAAQGGGRIRFDTNLDLAGVDLRPGGTLAKKPGDALAVKLSGSLSEDRRRARGGHHPGGREPARRSADRQGTGGAGREGEVADDALRRGALRRPSRPRPAPGAEARREEGQAGREAHRAEPRRVRRPLRRGAAPAGAAADEGRRRPRGAGEGEGPGRHRHDRSRRSWRPSAVPWTPPGRSSGWPTPTSRSRWSPS